MTRQIEKPAELAVWQAQNEAAIRSRLLPLLERDEEAEIITSPIQGIFLRRNGNVLELYCFDDETRQLSQIMSRIDLTDPLFLHATYLQAAFLTACWNALPPRSIYIAGYGGGRLAMLFRHCFPQIRIDGSELDPTILDLCKSHFGIELGSEDDIRLGDAAEDLANRNRAYDIIFLDTFSAEGAHPDAIGSVTFLDLCRGKLTDRGVLATNLVEMDPMLDRKRAAVAKTFPHSLQWQEFKSHVVFGSMAKPDTESLKSRVSRFAETNRIGFEYAGHCAKLQPTQCPNHANEHFEEQRG